MRDDQPLRCSDASQILKNVRISDLPKIMIKYSISFIFFGIIKITFEAINGPVNPVNICLSQVLDKIFPRTISLVVPKLTNHVRNSISSDEGLGIEKFLLE